MSCIHHATVRFADVDRAGIAFFATVFPLCHAAWEEVLAQVWAPDGLDAALADGRWCLPVVRAEATYRAPMRLGDRLAVRPSLHHLGDRSLAVNFEVVGEADGRLRAEVRLTLVAMAHRQAAAFERPVLSSSDSQPDGPPPPLPTDLVARLQTLIGPPR